MCKKEVETIAHFFWECTEATKLWAVMKQICLKITPGQMLEFSLNAVLSNEVTSKPDKVANFICLVTKNYMYTQRCLGKKYNKIELEELIFRYQRYEAFYAKKNNMLAKHNKKWNITENKGEFSALSEKEL